MPPVKNTARKSTQKTARHSAARHTTPKATPRTLSSSHKRALAEGRTNSAVVDRYLAALNTPKRRGRKVTRGTMEQRLAAAESRFKTASGVDKVLAAQEVRDLQTKLAQASATGGTDVKTLESAFTTIAKTFGEHRGISYGAWRDAGVPADVLRRAGIARTRS